jgi:hypothetical protein
MVLMTAALAAAVAAAEIPAGAVDAGNGVWRYTDARGKNWVYRKTPFGVSRTEDTGARPDPHGESALQERTASGDDAMRRALAGASSAVPEISAAAEGDAIRFTRRTPFGVSVWRRKATELNEQEREAWQRSQGAPSAR